MNEVRQYEEKWFRHLEDVIAVNLVKSEHGFNYTRDDDRDNLDDSTIFNSLLKTKMYRGLEFKKGWVKLKVAERNGTYFILSYDLRIKPDIHRIFKLSSPVDNILITHIKKIVNPDKLLVEDEINKELKYIMINTLSSLGADSSQMKKSDIEGISKFTMLIKYCLEISIFVDLVKDKSDGLYSGSLGIRGLNKITYFIELYNFENISELKDLISKDLLTMSDTVKETIRNNSSEDLLFGKVKNHQHIKSEPQIMKEYIIEKLGVGGFFEGKKITDTQKFESLEAAEKYKNEINSDSRGNIKIISVKEKI